MESTIAPDAHKDDYLDLEDSLNIDDNQKRHQCSLVTNRGKWLQIVKNDPRTSFSNKIPRHFVSLDEQYIRQCLHLINISAFKSASYSLIGSKIDIFPPYQFDSPVILKEDVARLVFDLPLVDDSGSPVISPVIAGCKRVTHSVCKPLLQNSEASDDDNAEKAISLKSTSSRSSYSEQSSSFWSPFSSVSQGVIEFTMKDNKTPHFVFSLDDEKEMIYVASLSSSSYLDYSYLIHLKKGRGSEPRHLVGKLKVSTSFSVSSTNEKTVERRFVLFSNGGNPQLPYYNDIKKNRGFPKKVVDALKSTARQRSISRFSRTSFCSLEPFQEPEHDLEHVSLLNDDLPPNLETSAIVVREELPEEDEDEEEEKVGGWGMKFLKKMPLARTKDTFKNCKHSTSVDVLIPAGIHGGTRKPSSLVQRWLTGGSCDCSGWDLGCPLTVLKGQVRKQEDEVQCNLFELFAEGLKQETPGLKIMNVRDGHYFVQFQAEISVLQSFSIALAYVHSQSQRLRPWSSRKCT